MPRNQNTTKVTGFSGVTNTVSPEELTRADRGQFPLLAGENVYLTNARRLKSREGYALQTAGSYHSLWGWGSGAFVASGTSLNWLDSDLNETAVATNLTSNSSFSYVGVANRVYFMNSVGERGMVVDGTLQPWGLPYPDLEMLDSTTGGLPEGSYRVAITQRTASGEESGASVLQPILLGDGEGILVTLPTAHADAAEFSIYCSLANGAELYEVGRVAAGTATFTIFNSQNHGQQLKTLDVIEPPAGSQIAYHSGRMYVVSGNYLYYSDPFAHSWFREEQFFAYPDEITLVAPVDGGLFVSADQTYYIAGDDPQGASQKVVSDAKAVKGTLAYIQPGDIPDVQVEQPVWITDRGYVVGSPGGAVQHLTEEEFTFAVSTEGSLSRVRKDGVTTLVGLMGSPNNVSNDFGMSDRVSVEIIRNSVV